MSPAILMIACAAIFFTLGTVHLIYTFFGPKLMPRDPALKERMMSVSPIISKETTMWRGWIGFNASHSLGALLFGAIYGFLALEHSQILFGSQYLLAVGLVMVGSFSLLSFKYWFSVPRNLIAIATICYMVSLILHLNNG